MRYWNHNIPIPQNKKILSKRLSNIIITSELMSINILLKGKNNFSRSQNSVLSAVKRASALPVMDFMNDMPVMEKRIIVYR